MTEVELPPAAYHPTEDDFEEPPIDTENAPHSVSQVEQLLRVAFAIGGKHHGMDIAGECIVHQMEYERENVFSDFTVDRSRIEESNDVWLSNQLDELMDQMQEVLEEEKTVHSRRHSWYMDMEDELRNKLQKANSMLRNGVEFKGIRVTNNPETNEEYHPSELSGKSIGELGYNLPIDLMVCESSDSGNMYPFLPWFGATVCTCGYKHGNPVSTLCKHELAALIKYSEDRFEPNERPVPERFKRLVSPEAYNQFNNNIDI